MGNVVKFGSGADVVAATLLGARLGTGVGRVGIVFEGVSVSMMGLLRISFRDDLREAVQSSGQFQVLGEVWHAVSLYWRGFVCSGGLAVGGGSQVGALAKPAH